MRRAGLTAMAAAAAVATLAAAIGPAAAQTDFIVRFYNSGTENGMTLQDGSKASPLLSWGAFAVHRGANPLYTPGQPAGDTGLEQIAEDGSTDKMVSWLAGQRDLGDTGALKARPVAGEATIHPGGLMRAVIKASPGDKISFAVMLEQSNDAFYGPGPEGIALFDSSGNPISGDVTDQVLFWDAGTEVNEAPGLGPNTGTTESGPNQGPSENAVVRQMSEVNDGFTYPAIKDVIKVDIKPR